MGVWLYKRTFIKVRVIGGGGEVKVESDVDVNV